MAKTAQEKGKVFEEEFQLYLKGLMQKYPAVPHRLYDTRSAGSYLPDQPGDFFLLFKGALHLWELKSSEVHDSLAANLSGLLSKEQATHHKLWRRAGAVTHVLFLQQRTGRVELWHGGHVAEVRHAAGKRLKRQDCLPYGSMSEFKEQFTEALLLDSRYGAPAPIKET